MPFVYQIMVQLGIHFWQFRNSNLTLWIWHLVDFTLLVILETWNVGCSDWNFCVTSSFHIYSFTCSRVILFASSDMIIPIISCLPIISLSILLIYPYNIHSFNSDIHKIGLYPCCLGNWVSELAVLGTVWLFSFYLYIFCN